MVRLAIGVMLAMTVLLSGCATTVPSGVADKASSAEAYADLGAQYLMAGDTNNAKLVLRQSLSFDDRYARAHNLLGVAFQQEREPELAEEYFRRAAELAPMDAAIHYNFGGFLFAQQRFAEACRYLARATEDPFYVQRAQAFESLGVCYRRIGRNDAAEHAFRRTLDLAATRPLAQIHLADLMLEQGNMPDAARLFHRYREQVEQGLIPHTPISLWVGYRVSRAERNTGRATVYRMMLASDFPQSEEYRLLKESGL